MDIYRSASFGKNRWLISMVMAVINLVDIELDWRTSDFEICVGQIGLKLCMHHLGQHGLGQKRLS